MCINCCNEVVKRCTLQANSTNDCEIKVILALLCFKEYKIMKCPSDGQSSMQVVFLHGQFQA